MAQSSIATQVDRQEQDRQTRIRLCNEWDLVPAEDLRNFNRFNEGVIADLQRRLKRATARRRRSA